MRAILELIIYLLSIPIGILNKIGCIVSVIWLAVLGEWAAIGYGIAALVVSGFILPIGFMPSALLAVPVYFFVEKIKIGGYFFAFLNRLYTVVIITVWCIAVLYFFTNKADSDSIIPMLIFSFNVAAGPWAWMTQKALQSGGCSFLDAAFPAFLPQFGYLVMIIMILFFRVSLIDVTLIFSAVMIVGLFLWFTLIDIEQE